MHKSKSSEHMSDEVADQLAVRSSTSTPWWWQLYILLRFRTLKNYSDPAWVAPRIADKLVFALIILTLYWGVGDNPGASNIVNITSALFMW